MTDVLLLARVAASLLVVLALVVITLKLAGPWLQKVARPKSGRIAVAEVVPLDRQHHVALVRVDQRELLVGFGSGSITRLADWPAAPPLSPAAVPEEVEP